MNGLGQTLEQTINEIDGVVQLVIRLMTRNEHRR